MVAACSAESCPSPAAEGSGAEVWRVRMIAVMIAGLWAGFTGTVSGSKVY